MIYIFEDRFERRNNNRDTITRYSDIVRFAQFDIESGQDLSDFIVDKFGDADCVLFHKSYSLTSWNVNLNNIQETFKELLDGKFILFSGGTERGTINEKGEIAINADVMYENLDFFLETFRDSKQLKYEILLWGKNYSLNQRLSQQVRVHIDKFLDDDLSKPIASAKLEEIIEDIEGEGFEIAEIVNNKADSSDDIITLDEIRNIVQSKID